MSPSVQSESWVKGMSGWDRSGEGERLAAAGHFDRALTIMVVGYGTVCGDGIVDRVCLGALATGARDVLPRG
jgi:hypothetical protein